MRLAGRSAVLCVAIVLGLSLCTWSALRWVHEPAHSRGTTHGPSTGHGIDPGPVFGASSLGRDGVVLSDAFASAASRLARNALIGTATLWVILKSDVYIAILGIGYGEEVVLWALVRVSFGRWGDISHWEDDASLNVQIAGALVGFALWHLVLTEAYARRTKREHKHADVITAATTAAVARESSRARAAMAVHERIVDFGARAGAGVSSERLLYVLFVLAVVIAGSGWRSTRPLETAVDGILHLGVGLLSGARRAVHEHYSIRLNALEILAAPARQRLGFRLWVFGEDGTLDVLGYS